jgi:hypothetical protein
VGGDEGHVDVTALADGLAVVDRLEHGQFAGPLLHQPGQPVQVLPPVASREVGPGAVVGGAGGGDGAVDVLGTGGHDLGQDLLGGRVDGLERRAVDRVDQLTVDEQTVAGGDVDDRPGLGCGCVVEHAGTHQSRVK